MAWIGRKTTARVGVRPHAASSRFCYRDSPASGRPGGGSTAERSYTIFSPRTQPLDPDKLVESVLGSLDDDKAEEVTVIDLRGRSSITDYMVIATGRSQRQVGAMADHLMEKLKKFGLAVGVEGVTQGDWVLIDAGDIVVHLFRPEVRSFYNLERMWSVRPADPIEGKAGALTA